MTALYAAALGWAVGMRSMTPPAVLARGLARGLRPRRQPGKALASAVRWLPLAAAGEMAADKLPAMPDRTSPPVLAGRVLSGAAVGAALGQARRTRPVAGALAGVAGAVASSFVMMRLRQRVGRRLDLPDAAVAVAEDALAVGLSLVVVRSALR